MNKLCKICGLEEAIYTCITCKKQYCMEDWNNTHSESGHQTCIIRFLVYEESRKILINFFEKLKEETNKIFNLNKEKAALGEKDGISMLMKFVKINSLLNAVIFYIMKVKVVPKRLIYNPIVYYLINPIGFAEIFIGSFNLSQFQKTPLIYIQGFLMHNYLLCESAVFCSFKFSRNYLKLNLWSDVMSILVYYIRDRKYQTVLKILEDFKTVLMFDKWLMFDVNDSISKIQEFIIPIFFQNYNIDLIAWKKFENIINMRGYYYETLIFYITFLAIFYNIGNTIYFERCSKCILRITKNSCQILKKSMNFILPIYILLDTIYSFEGNSNRLEKYAIKSLHLWKKKWKLRDNSPNFFVLGFLINLIYVYSTSGQFDKLKKCNKKFWYYLKNSEPKSPTDFIQLLLVKGEFYYFNHDYEPALDYLKNFLHESKKTKYKEGDKRNWVNYHIGEIYYMKNDLQNAVKHIYKAKESIEMQFGDFLNERIWFNTILGDIYFRQNWMDKALNYFSLAKDSYLKLIGNKRLILTNAWIFRIEYCIALSYKAKGEITISLNSCENLLFLLENGTNQEANSTFYIISLHWHIWDLYIQLDDEDKYVYHSNMCLEIFDGYMLDPNFIFDSAKYVLIIAGLYRNWTRCEEICLNLLKLLSCNENEEWKIIISIYLMNAYANQGLNEKSNELIESIESKLTDFNWHELLLSHKNLYILIGETFYLRKNYYKADIYLKKAKDIYENTLKTKIFELGVIYVKIGDNCLSWEKYDDSEHYFLKALDIFANLNNDRNQRYVVLIQLEILYRRRNDLQSQKHYLLEFIKLCKEKNFYHGNYRIQIGLLIIIFKRDKDDINGIAYWNELIEYSKKKGVDVKLYNEFIIFDDEKNIEIGRISLEKY